jgi:hypothetical protein
MDAIVASTPRPSERDPAGGIEAVVLRRIVHRCFRRGVLGFALTGCRREGREGTAALRRAEGFGWTGFFSRGDVTARGAGLVNLGVRRGCAGRFSAMAPAINAPICCRYCATSVSRSAMRRSWA